MTEHRTLPLLPLRDGVLLPGTVATIPVGRPASVALVNAVAVGGVVAVGVQRDAAVAEPDMADLYDVAVLARIAKVQRMPRGYQVTLEGLGRLRVQRIVEREPFLQADCETVVDIAKDAARAADLAIALRAELTDVKSSATGAFARALDGLLEEEDGGRLADRTAGAMGLPVAKELEILQAADVVDRLTLVMGLVVEQRTAGDLRQKIDSEVRKEFQKHQKEAILREQMRAIKKELGDDDGKSDIDKLAERVEKADLPDEVRKVAERELSRLQGQASGPEQGVIRHYLEWIVDLPWNVKVPSTATVSDVEAKLDEDHTGLIDVRSASSSTWP